MTYKELKQYLKKLNTEKSLDDLFTLKNTTDDLQRWKIKKYWVNIKQQQLSNNN